MVAAFDAAFDMEARRLAAIADDLEERLRDLERRAETARELSVPGPTRTDLAHARKLVKAARAQANAAARFTRKGRRAA